MKKLKCPECQDAISFTAFAKAPTPWHIKCQNCKSKLKVGKYAGTTFSLALLLGMTIGFIFSVYNISFMYFILSLLLIAIVAEYICFTLAVSLGIDLKLRE